MTQHLLRILLMYELESSKVAPFWWSGKFSAPGESVIAQHSAQSGLTSTDCALAQWSAYTTVHSSHSLAFKLFETLLEKLVRHIRTVESTSDDAKMFWEGIRKLLPSCFSVLRNIRKRTAGDKNAVKILNEVVSILSIVGKLTPPTDFDLFPRNVYGYVLGNFSHALRLIECPVYSWLKNIDATGPIEMRTIVEEAIRCGAKEYFHHVNGIANKKGCDEDKLQNIIKITQLIRSDLQRGIEYYDKLFQE